jgi:preprotein translocase subunit SecB
MRSQFYIKDTIIVRDTLVITSSFKFHWMLINTLYIGKDGEVLVSISCQVQGVFFLFGMHVEEQMASLLHSEW